MPPRNPSSKVTFYVTQEGLAFLREYDFPCSEHILVTATVTEDGIRLIGTRSDVGCLLGFVAGEANHSREQRRRRAARIFDELADAMESALAANFTM